MSFAKLKLYCDSDLFLKGVVQFSVFVAFTEFNTLYNE